MVVRVTLKVSSRTCDSVLSSTFLSVFELCPATDMKDSAVVAFTVQTILVIISCNEVHCEIWLLCLNPIVILLSSNFQKYSERLS